MTNYKLQTQKALSHKDSAFSLAFFRQTCYANFSS